MIAVSVADKAAVIVSPCQAFADGGVVRAGLSLARANGLPVYVEVMNPENVGYYRHVGFETIAEFDIPDAGPHVCSMICRA